MPPMPPLNRRLISICDVANMSALAASFWPSRSRAHRRLALVLSGFATAAATVAADADPANLLLPRDAIVAGHDLDWYAQDWWQWVFSIPFEQNPVSDTDGRFCGAGQSGPVWYLAGGFGSSRLHRTCSVPADRHLFFPIVIYLVTTRPEQSSTCAEVRRKVLQDQDHYVHLVVELNGVQLPDLHQMRITPEQCFDLAGGAAPEFESRAYYPSATDGYWVMLAPLPAGDHRLEFRGFFSVQKGEEQMVQNIIYDLHIEEALKAP
jgi:hypothetical protein